MLLLIKLVDVAVTPGGRGTLFGPNIHSSISDELEGMLSGRPGSGLGVIVAEHTRVEFSPAVYSGNQWMR